MSATNPQACMGGWCLIRGHCPHYLSRNRVDPLERICINGHDGLAAEEGGQVRQIDIVMPASHWEGVSEAAPPQKKFRYQQFGTRVMRIEIEQSRARAHFAEEPA